MRSLLTLLSIVLVASPVLAEFPYPPNPNPCDGANTEDCILGTEWSRYLFLPVTDPPTVPNDFRDDWKLTSARTGDPEIDSNPQELFGIKGASVDRAWQVTTGRPDVVIAVLDSGIRWGERQDDLVNKFYLNRGELPVPEGSRNEVDPHDRNGDGVFNVRDYLEGGGFAQDGRVSDQNGTGAIDPEDLIFLFSDGTDADGNGFIDDISGWDFFEDDNNALDEVRYGHGTGESEDSGSEANNGIGGRGTCPNCMLLEVRVGDSFVTDVNRFARGVLFAVDSGAKVVQEALGTLNQSSFGQQAVDYAYKRGVVVMASAADEQSAHNNWPANYSHTFEINSVVKFFESGTIVQTPKSYLYLNGCTNYNGHIAVAVPSSACSSEATGQSSGMAGLVYAAALNAIDEGTLDPYADGIPLSAEEVRQIFMRTADDINFDARSDVDPPLPQNYFTDIPLPGVAQTSRRFPSIAGFDQYFGYGRINAYEAVRRVQEGRIPPEAAIESPAWHSYLPLRQGVVDVRGAVAARRAQSYHYTVEVAAGVQQAESAFVSVARSAELTAPTEGILASLSLPEIAELLPHGASGSPVLDDGSGRGDPDRFAFTVRVRVYDNQGGFAEDRRTLHLHDDPQLVNGFPRSLGGDGGSPPIPADLDGDGTEELLVATSDGTVHAFLLDGSELPGWPVRTNPLEVQQDSPAYLSGEFPLPHIAILAELAVGDVDGDGTLEIFAADIEGYVYGWRADGTALSGFPVSTLPEYSHPRRSERDLTTDRGRNPDRWNRHDRHNRLARGFGGGPVLANLDGSLDGSLEIIAGANDRHVYAWHSNGAPVAGWPVLIKDPAKVDRVDEVSNEVTLKANARALDGTKIIRAPSVADLDGDGDLEVVVVVNEQYEERPNASFDNATLNFLIAGGLLNPGNTRVYALHHDGVAHGGTGQTRGWNPAAFVPGWPVATALLTTEILPVVGSGSDGSAVLADLDGDRLPEIATHSVIGPVYLLNGDGTSMLGVNARRQPVVLGQEPFGENSNSRDNPTFGAFGGPAVAELRGPGTGWNIAGPTVGFGKSIDAALPAAQSPADNLISAWSTDRNLLPGFPRQTNDLQFFVVPIISDITGDGVAEIIQGSGVRDVHAIDADGIEAPGWPKFTAGWTVAPSAVADLDHDGFSEVAHVTREGSLFVWRTEAPRCAYQPWRHARHDLHATNHAHTDGLAPAAIRSVAVESIAPGELTLAIDGAEGSDLRCGAAPQFDVRYSRTPIVSLAEFDSATAVDDVEATPTDGRTRLRLRADEFVDTTLHIALRARDAAGNRTRIENLAAVSFPAPPTPTASPTNTPTFTTSPTTTPTSSPSPTLTPTISHHDASGCGLTKAPTKQQSSLLAVGYLFLVFARLLSRRNRAAAPQN